MQRWPTAACAARFQRFFRLVAWSRSRMDDGGRSGARVTESRGPAGPPSDADVVEMVAGQRALRHFGCSFSMTWKNSELCVADVVVSCRCRPSCFLLRARFPVTAVDVAGSRRGLLVAAAAHRLVVGVLGRRVLLVAEDRSGRGVDAARAVDDGVDHDRGGRCRSVSPLLDLLASVDLDGARSGSSAFHHRHLDRLASPRRGAGHLVGASADGAERAPVEDDHEDARHVEGHHRREDDEIGVVEDAQPRRAGASRRVVHAERYRQRDGDRHDPRQRQRYVNSTRVAVLGVLDWARHGDKPAQTHHHNSVQPSEWTGVRLSLADELQLIRWTLTLVNVYDQTRHHHWLSVTSAFPPSVTGNFQLLPLVPATVCLSAAPNGTLATSLQSLLLAHLHIVYSRGPDYSVVTVAGMRSSSVVCRRHLLSSSVTLHGGPAGGGQALTSCSLGLIIAPRLHGGPVVLRLVRATPCCTSNAHTHLLTVIFP